MGASVSVIIPAYNVGAYLGECLDSIFDGTYQDFHIFLCDDGSSDDTLGVARRYQEQRGKMTVVRNTRNRGVCYTRNRLIGMADGKYIAFHDGDDLMVPGRLQVQVEFLDAHADVDVVGGWLYKFTDDPGSSAVLARRPLIDADIKIYMAFSQAVCIGTATMLGESLRGSGVRFDEGYANAEDYEFFSRLVPQMKFANINRPAAFVRVHTGSLSYRQSDLMIASHVKTAKQYLRTRFNIDAQDDVINIFAWPQDHSPKDVSAEQSRRLLGLTVDLLNTDLVRSGAVTAAAKRFIVRRLLTYFTHIPPDALAVMGLHPTAAAGNTLNAAIWSAIKRHTFRALMVTGVWGLRGLRGFLWRKKYSQHVSKPL